MNPWELLVVSFGWILLGALWVAAATALVLVLGAVVAGFQKVFSKSNASNGGARERGDDD